MSKSLFRSLSTVSSMTFISRILGFMRDLIAAQIFGSNATTDAFYIAFKIPNFMRNLFAEGAFSQAFVPVLSHYHEKNTMEEVRLFIGRTAGALSLILFLVTLLFIFCSDQIIDIFAPGLDPFRYETASHMLKITAPYLMLISLTAFGGAILNTYGNFAIPAFAPALLNICLIATSFGITQYFTIPIEAQAWGVFIAGFVQFFFLLPSLHRLRLLTRPRLCWSDPGVKKVLKLMLPALFGASINQISILLNTVLASFLVVGSVTWLYYSERLAYFPLGVFGVALSTITLPVLSKHYASQSKTGFSNTLNWAIRCNLLIGIPAALTMIFLSDGLVTSLFQYGKFNLHDVLMTQKSVISYAIGLQAFMLVKVLSSAFYSQQNITTPVKISLITLAFNLIFSVAFIFPLAHAGLALATSLSSWINVCILLFQLHRRNIYRFQQGWGKFLFQLFFGNGLLSLFLWYFSPNTEQWIHWHWPERLSHMTLLGFSAIALYVAALWAAQMRMRDLKSHTG